MNRTTTQLHSVYYTKNGEVKERKIDWEKLWKQFDKWYDKGFAYTWEEQRKKIEKLVNKQLKK